MTKEEIIKMAKQAGFERLGHDEHDYVCYPDDIVAFATLVASTERDACANICEEKYYLAVADAIRARGEQE